MDGVKKTKPLHVHVVIELSSSRTGAITYSMFLVLSTCVQTLIKPQVCLQSRILLRVQRCLEDL